MPGLCDAYSGTGVLTGTLYSRADASAGSTRQPMAGQTLTLVVRQCQSPAAATGRAQNAGGSRPAYCKGASLSFQYGVTGNAGQFSLTLPSGSGLAALYLGRVIANPVFDPAFYSSGTAYDPRRAYLKADPTNYDYKGYQDIILAPITVPDDPNYRGGIAASLFPGSDTLWPNDHSDDVGNNASTNPCDCTSGTGSLLTGTPVGSTNDFDDEWTIPSGVIPLPPLAPLRLSQIGSAICVFVYATSKFTIGTGGIQILENPVQVTVPGCSQPQALYRNVCDGTLAVELGSQQTFFVMPQVRTKGFFLPVPGVTMKITDADGHTETRRNDQAQWANYCRFETINIRRIQSVEILAGAPDCANYVGVKPPVPGGSGWDNCYYTLNKDNLANLPAQLFTAHRYVWDCDVAPGLKKRPLYLGADIHDEVLTVVADSEPLPNVAGPQMLYRNKSMRDLLDAKQPDQGWWTGKQLGDTLIQGSFSGLVYDERGRLEIWGTRADKLTITNLKHGDGKPAEDFPTTAGYQGLTDAAGETFVSVLRTRKMVFALTHAPSGGMLHLYNSREYGPDKEHMLWRTVPFALLSGDRYGLLADCGLWMGCLYTYADTGHLFWRRAHDPLKWPVFPGDPDGKGKDTGISAQIGGGGRLDSGLLLGLTWNWWYNPDTGTQEGNKAFRTIRSADNGLTWTREAADVDTAIIPAMERPPVMIVQRDTLFAVWITADGLPVFASTVDSGKTWQGGE